MSSSGTRVTVVGAGIVGMCCALRLQQDGHRVTVIDPRPPGTATSFGNAGIIGTGAIMPYSTPGLWKKIPWFLFDSASPLQLRLRYLPRAAPWLIRFLAAGNRRRVERTASEMAPLVTVAEQAHRELMKAHRIDPELMRAVGYLEVYDRSESFDDTEYERELWARHGIRVDVLNADEIHQLEPGLARRFQWGLFNPDEGFVTEPVALTRAYLDAFRSLGGETRHETVRRFEIGPDGPRKVVTDLGMHDVDRLVIAAGAWSRGLAESLGSPVPLESKRGYHLNFSWNDRVTLNRPVLVADRYYTLCPMRDGIRITTGAEFGGLDSPPNFEPIHRIVDDARRALCGLDGQVNREWMGHRPVIPDSKPVVARSPHFNRVFFAFGHGHLGLTLSAITGRAISDLVAERRCDVPLDPFQIDRF